MTIEPICASDWSQILQLQAGAYTGVEPETLEVLQSKWHASPQTCFVYKRKQNIVGYVLAHPWHQLSPPKLFKLLTDDCGGEYLFVHDLAVDQQVKSQGIGKAMMAYLANEAKMRGYQQIQLVAVQNSTRFWQKQGFEPLSQTVSSSYGDGAKLMCRVL